MGNAAGTTQSKGDKEQTDVKRPRLPASTSFLRGLDVVLSHGAPLLRPSELASLDVCSRSLHDGPVRSGWAGMFKFLSSLQTPGRRGTPLLCFSAPAPAVLLRAGGHAHGCKLLLCSDCEYCHCKTGYANPLTLRRICHDCAEHQRDSVVCTTAKAKTSLGLTDADLGGLVVTDVPAVPAACCWPEESGGRMLLIRDALAAQCAKEGRTDDEDLLWTEEGFTGNRRHIGIIELVDSGWRFAQITEPMEENWDYAVSSFQRFTAWQAEQANRSLEEDDDDDAYEDTYAEMSEGCPFDHGSNPLHPDDICCCCKCGSVCAGGCCPSCFYWCHVDYHGISKMEC
jgi:hypothetical protein